MSYWTLLVVKTVCYERFSCLSHWCTAIGTKHHKAGLGYIDERKQQKTSVCHIGWWIATGALTLPTWRWMEFILTMGIVNREFLSTLTFETITTKIETWHSWCLSWKHRWCVCWKVFRTSVWRCSEPYSWPASKVPTGLDWGNENSIRVTFLLLVSFPRMPVADGWLTFYYWWFVIVNNYIGCQHSL